MAVLLTLLLGFQMISDNGFTLVTFGCLSLSVLFFVAFVMIEKRAQDPVIDLHLFNQPTFVLVNLIAALISGFLMGIDVYIPMWMQGVLGKSAGIGALVLAPMSLLWMAGSFIASSFMEKYAMKKVLTIGLSILLVGAIFLVVMPMAVPFWLFFVVSSVLGVGFGITITTTTVTAQSTVEPEKMGVATSFNTLVRTIGADCDGVNFWCDFKCRNVCEIGSERVKRRCRCHESISESTYCKFNSSCVVKTITRYPLCRSA